MESRTAWFWTVVTVAIVATAVLYGNYLRNPEVRWARLDNDRNAHYLTALQLGSDLRALRLASVVNDLRRIRSWPPLHAVMIGLASAVVGPRYELAVLPNVVAWGIGIVLVFVLTRRIALAAGNVAGMIAVTFYLGSPSHRAFATDFMLESMGSTLTLLCLWLYVVYRQSGNWMDTRSLQRLRNLAIAMTLLFFEKYNYWLLVLLSLIIVELMQVVLAQRSKLLRRAGEFLSNRDRLVAWMKGQVRNYWNYPVFVLAGLWAWKVLWQTWQALTHSATAPASQHENLVYFLYIAMVVRVVMCWKHEGGSIWSRLPPLVQIPILWHILPIAIWFLLPKRLGYFLWYLSPANGRNTVDRSLGSSMAYYAEQAGLWYHTSTWLAIVVLVLALANLLRLRTMSMETRTVAVFVVLAMLLTLHHPNQKTRFLHSWIAGLWVLAGCGAVVIVNSMLCRLPRRCRWVSYAGCVLVLVRLQFPGYGSIGASPESGHYPGRSSLAISRAYLPWLRAGARTAVLGTLPIEYYAEWTFIAEYPDRQRPATTQQMRWFGVVPAENERNFVAWLQAFHPDQIVLIDVHDGSPVGFPDFDHFRQFRDLLPSQGSYHRVRLDVLDGLGCTVSLWEPSTLP